MEYRGIQYQIVQTANPAGFKWVVQFRDGSTKIGTTLTQNGAIFAAKYAIDKAKNEPKMK
jgi:hypothetical protein